MWDGLDSMFVLIPLNLFAVCTRRSVLIEAGKQRYSIKQIINHAGNIPGMYDDLIQVIAPQSRHTGPAQLLMARYNDVFLDSQYVDGGSGPVYEFELIYHPTTTVGGVEGLKRPQPDGVRGVELGDLGDDKELYRWFFLQKNNRSVDAYVELIERLQAISPSSLDQFSCRFAAAVGCRSVVAGVRCCDSLCRRRQLQDRWTAAQCSVLCPTLRWQASDVPLGHGFFFHQWRNVWASNE